MADAACAMGTCASISAPAARQQTAGRMRSKAVLTPMPALCLGARLPAEGYPLPKAHAHPTHKNEFCAAVTITFVHPGLGARRDAPEPRGPGPPAIGCIGWLCLQSTETAHARKGE